MEELAGNAVIARPHFAQVMVRHGYVSTNREAFDRYLDTDEYQKIERFKVSARDCIAAIRSDGGCAALARPYQLGLDDERLEALIRQLKDSGLNAFTRAIHQSRPRFIWSWRGDTTSTSLAAVTSTGNESSRTSHSSGGS